MLARGSRKVLGKRCACACFGQDVHGGEAVCACSWRRTLRVTRGRSQRPLGREREVPCSPSFRKKRDLSRSAYVRTSVSCTRTAAKILGRTRGGWAIITSTVGRTAPSTSLRPGASTSTGSMGRAIDPPFPTGAMSRATCTTDHTFISHRGASPRCAFLRKDLTRRTTSTAMTKSRTTPRSLNAF